MATKASNLAKKQMQVRENVADLWVETLRSVAPKSTEHLLTAGMHWLEAHREFLAEHVARLEKAKAKVAKGSRRAASRKVPVKGTARRTGKSR